MRKLISIFLSLVLFFCIGPMALAGGIDKIDILSDDDGTKLTYVSTANIHRIRQEFVEKIKKNQARKISVGRNVLIKTASLVGGVLLCYAELKIENSLLCANLIVRTAVISLMSFFYPEYIRYDINQIENCGEEVGCRFTRDDYDRYNPSSRQGLSGMLSRIDRCIRALNDGNETIERGIIIVERPKGYKEKYGTDGLPSGVYAQDPYYPDWPYEQIKNELIRRSWNT